MCITNVKIVFTSRRGGRGLRFGGEGRMESIWGTGKGHGSISSLSDFNRFFFLVIL